MRRSLRHQRILFLCLFSVCVFAPVVFVAHRSKYISSTGRREFAEGFPTFKYRADALKLNSVQQEGGQSLKEPKLVVYEDKGRSSILSDSSSNKIRDGSDTSTNTGGVADILERNGTRPRTTKKSRHERTASTAREKEKRNPMAVHDNKKLHAQSLNPTDKKVKELKDQLIRAKAYLNFAPPGSNSHLVRELKLRSKELERTMGDTTKDSALSKSALQRSRAMEASLTKASRVYPECSSMATKLRAMTYNAEEQVQAQKDQAAYLLHLAARTTPKGLHCLTMRLTAEYFMLPPEERKFANQQNVHNEGLHHYAVFSDNILACAVVVNSTISSALEPEKVVFHIVTDSLNFPTMSMWFLQNPPPKATLDIRSTQDFEWLSNKYSSMLQRQNMHDPRYASALNHLRFYLPDIFPFLNKILLLDHDVVVQRDLNELWNVDMMGKVNGAVETCQESEVSYRRMDIFVNFSDPFVSERFDPNTCTWAFGMNLFDLQEWRRQNLTTLYHSYLQLGQTRQLWKDGSLPIGWVTFYNQTMALERRWHVLGLGYNTGIPKREIENGSVIHYDGVMKPWLEIGIGKYKGYWSKHVIYDHPYLQQCNIHP